MAPWSLVDRGDMGIQLNTVVPGFKALGPSTALSALNPGTILLSYKEIVFKLKVDLNNPIYIFKKTQKNWKKTQVFN